MRIRIGGALVVLLAIACGGSNGPAGPADGGTDGGAPDSGTLDCGALTACQAQCVDLTSDSANCGACGHDCQGGACTAGACQPVMLASGEDLPNRLALHDGWLYWTSFGGGAVKRVAIGGGAVQIVAADQSEPNGFCVDDAHAYWLAGSFPDGGVFEAPLDGGAPTLLLTSSHSNSLTEFDGRLYWGDSQFKSMDSVALDGGGATRWSLPLTPTDIATDGQWLYFGTVGSNVSNLYRIDLDGGELTALAPAQTTIRLVVRDGQVAWIDTGFQSQETVNAGVSVMPLDGGAARRIAGLTTLIYPEPGGRAWAGLAADAQYVYWTDLADGAVFRATWDGGSPEPVVANQDNPVGIAVDATTVYWSTFGLDGGGTVMKLAK